MHAGSLRWGFAFDDYPHQYVLRGLAGDRLPVWNLYDFSPPAARELQAWNFDVWWAGPEFKVRFFRPVASLSLWLDHALFGDWAAGYHLTSLALFAVFLGLVLALYRRIGLSSSATVFALLLVAVEDAHTLPAEWLANRNTLLADIFIVATVLLVARQQRTRRPVWLAASGLAFLLACGSKESGLAALPITALYLLLWPVDADSAAGRARVAAMLRCPAIWLLGALAVLFLSVYIAGGYGAHSEVYPVPWRDPGVFAARLGPLLPLAAAALFFGLPLDLVAIAPQTLWPVTALATLALAAAGSAYVRIVRTTPRVLFGLGWLVLALIVESGGDYSARLLSGAAIGAGILFGELVAALGPGAELRARRQWGRIALAAVLFLGGPVSSIVQSLGGSTNLSRLADHDRRAIATAPIDRAAPPPRYIFLLNSPSSLLALSFASTWSVLNDDRDTVVLPLQLGWRPLRVAREDPRTLLVTSLGTPLTDNRIERIFHDRRRPSTGDSFAALAFTATVVEAEPAGVRSARLVFDRPLDDPSYLFLAFRNGRFERVAPPAPGETVTFPEVPRLAWYVP